MQARELRALHAVPRGGFFVVAEDVLNFDFRVRFNLTADDIIKIIHAVTIERALMALLPIAGVLMGRMT